MKFRILTPFKLWFGDRLIADYQPGLGYTVREGNDRLRALVKGGALPGSESATIEFPDLRQVEIKPGEECPGWANEGLVVITSLEAAGGIAGVAEVKEG